MDIQVTVAYSDAYDGSKRVSHVTFTSSESAIAYFNAVKRSPDVTEIEVRRDTFIIMYYGLPEYNAPAFEAMRQASIYREEVEALSPELYTALEFVYHHESYAMEVDVWERIKPLVMPYVWAFPAFSQEGMMFVSLRDHESVLIKAAIMIARIDSIKRIYA